MKTKTLPYKKRTLRSNAHQLKGTAGKKYAPPSPVQRVIHPDMDTALATVLGQAGPDITQFDPSLQTLFTEAEGLLPQTDFIPDPHLARAAEASKNPNAPPNYLLEYNPNWNDQDYLVSSILHEMIHVTTDVYYDKGGLAQGPNGEIPEFVNVNFPNGLGGNQVAINAEMRSQRLVLEANLRDAIYVATNDGGIGQNLKAHILDRLNNYALAQPMVHYDTVLADIMTYMQLQNATATDTFRFIKRLINESTDRRTYYPRWGTQRARRVDRKTWSLTFWKW